MVGPQIPRETQTDSGQESSTAQMSLTTVLAWLEGTGTGITLTGKIRCESWPTLLEAATPGLGEASTLPAAVVGSTPRDPEFPGLTTRSAVYTETVATLEPSEVNFQADGFVFSPFATEPLPAWQTPLLPDQSQVAPVKAATQEVDIKGLELRVDKEARLFKLLNLCDKAELIQFMRQPWVASALKEFADSFLNEYHRQNVEYIKLKGAVARQSSKPHKWKIEMAVAAVRARDVKYCGATPDKSLWVPEDHDFRFIVRVVIAAEANTGHAWDAAKTTETLVTRAFTLTLWLRWVHRPVVGQSAEMKRSNKLKEYWVQVLSSIRQQVPLSPQPHKAPGPGELDSGFVYGQDDPGLPFDAHGGGNRGVGLLGYTPYDASIFDRVMLESPQTSMASFFNTPTQSPLILPRTPLSRRDITAVARSGPLKFPPVTSHPRESPPPNPFDATSGHGSDTHDAPAALACIDPALLLLDDSVFDFDSALAPLNQQQGVYWLTEEAFDIFRDQLGRLLNPWGVTADHEGSCVLAATSWAHLTPEQVTSVVGPEIVISEGRDQLQLSIGDLTTTWARAIAWFAAWPAAYRKAGELEGFLAGEVEDAASPVYGSHTCGHALCVNPRHVVLETRAATKSRTACMAAAKSCREGGALVSRHCESHDPPCLLVHAALTSHETLAIQDWVLRLSRGLATAERQVGDRGSFERALPASFERDPTSMDTTRLFWGYVECGGNGADFVV